MTEERHKMSAQVLKSIATGKENPSALLKTVAKDAGIGSVKSFFESQKEVIRAMLPKHVSPDRMLRIGLGAIRQNPKLLDCTIESLFGGLVLCSQFGLEPNTPMGHCYLIPFSTNKRLPNGKTEKVTEVQFIAGYRGLIDLSRRSGQIESISARVVYSNDEFELEYGTVDEIRHKPAYKDRGEVIGYYAVAKLKGGGKQFEFMPQEEIEQVRDGSQNASKDEWVDGRKTGNKIRQESSPWWKNPTEMGKKTVVRRLFKYLPTSIEMANAIGVDEKADSSGSQDLGEVLTGEYQVVSQYEEEHIDKTTGEITNTKSPKDPDIDFDAIKKSIEEAKTPKEINISMQKVIQSNLNQEHKDALIDLSNERLSLLS